MGRVIHRTSTGEILGRTAMACLHPLDGSLEGLCLGIGVRIGIEVVDEPGDGLERVVESLKILLVAGRLLANHRVAQKPEGGQSLRGFTVDPPSERG